METYLLFFETCTLSVFPNDSLLEIIRDLNCVVWRPSNVSTFIDIVMLFFIFSGRFGQFMGADI